MTHLSNECVKKYGKDGQYHPYFCENVYWSPTNDKGSFTLHTHLVKDHGGEEPSQADINTTFNKLKKDQLCIINTDGHWLKCWDKDLKITHSRTLK